MYVNNTCGSHLRFINKSKCSVQYRSDNRLGKKTARRALNNSVFSMKGEPTTQERIEDRVPHTNGKHMKGLVWLCGVLMVLVASAIVYFFWMMPDPKHLSAADKGDKLVLVNVPDSKPLLAVYKDYKLVLVNVAEWGGKNTTGPVRRLKLPVEKVIIAHTVTEGCFTLDDCSYRARFIQAYYMDTLGWNQVIYNFMIGGDGRIYVGRGWDYVGAPRMPYISISISVAFIGDFDHMEPTEQQLKACLLLMDEGVRLKKLKPEYKIFGHRQLEPTESPDKNLYKIIQNWPHFDQGTAN